MVTLTAGEGLAQGQLPANEHWLILEGILQVEVEQRAVELYKGDVALLRAGVVRSVGTNSGARVALVRERG